MMKNGGGHEEGYGLLGKYPARVEFPVFYRNAGFDEVVFRGRHKAVAVR